jgi:hypothetical protein
MKICGNWDRQDRAPHYAWFEITVSLSKLRRKAREIPKYRR